MNLMSNLKDKSKICPYYQKPCLLEKCLAYSGETCLIIPLGRLERETTTKVPVILKTKSIKELAEKLADYYLEKYPDGENYRYTDTSLFWSNRIGVKEIYNLPSDIQEKIQDVERLAEDITEDRKIPEELKSQKPEKIAENMVKWAEKNFDITRYVYFRKYWGSKGLPESYYFSDRYRPKAEKCELLAEQKLEEIREKRKKEKKEKEKQQALAEIDNIIKWLKEKRLVKLSKANLKLYFSEIGMKVSPTNRQNVYIRVNEILKQEK